MAAPTAPVTFADVSVGDQLPPLTVTITRADLVRYAGASLDFNPIHWNEKIAADVGLPNVIAHGMLTMALAGRLVTDWAGDPAAVIGFSTKFTRPVVVPNDDSGATVELAGKITEKSADGTVKVEITAVFDGRTVLGRPTAIVRLP
ncbi:MAG TPA: MaoC family dehydratase [Pseudonocardiaceae bacterium]|jgi:acyl dehydratase|nr:MaoC family dehydratase [Pseudonocardiaceae bacterium]